MVFLTVIDWVFLNFMFKTNLKHMSTKIIVSYFYSYLPKNIFCSQMIHYPTTFIKCLRIKSGFFYPIFNMHWYEPWVELFWQIIYIKKKETLSINKLMCFYYLFVLNNYFHHLLNWLVLWFRSIGWIWLYKNISTTKCIVQ